MDPNVNPEQPGITQDGGQAEDGAAFLRRMKAQSGTSSPSADDGNSIVPATDAAAATVERRRSPRFSCSGSVEILADGTDVRMWGTLSDISLHGCYAEMTTTFPINTQVTLLIHSLGLRVCARAKVVVSYPFLGMGLTFTEIEPGQQFQLEQLMRALAGERAILNSPPAAQPGLPEILASADPWPCLEAICQFFKKHPELSQEEFYEIAKRVRRS